jgi:hypothetical protein
MSLIDPIALSFAGAARAAAKRARASKTLNSASGLAAGLPEQEETSAQNTQEEIDETLVHCGTVNDVSFRHAQSDFNFTPTFITQLLGQLLPDPEQKGSGALAAYKELYARIRVFDRLL